MKLRRRLPEPPRRRELRRAARAMDPRGKPNKAIVVAAVLVTLKCVMLLVARARRQRRETPPDETA